MSIDPAYIMAKAKGQQVRVACPACEPTRKTRNDPSLSIHTNPEGVLVWQCWHCGETGRTGGDKPRPTGEQPMAVMPIRKIESDSLSLDTLVYLQGRCISQATAESLGVVSGNRWFKKLSAERPALGFVYGQNGNAYAAKWRSLEGKDFTAEGAAVTLYLADRLTDTSRVVITEGEMDALSYWEVGIEAVSIPSGAIASGTADDAARLRWIAAHDELMANAKEIYLAVDMDDPGQTTAQELARRLGKIKCYKVEFPSGTKDANDVLVKHGADALRATIKNAQPWPIEGVAQPVDFHSKVMDLYKNGLPPGNSTGWSSVDDVYTLCPGNLVVVTGIPGHGKALALDTEVPTPNGWTTMGAIEVGDLVYAPDGTITKVVRVSDVMNDRPCFRLSFKDGVSVVADADHQWVTRDEKARNSHYANKAKRGDRANISPKGTDQTHKRTHPSTKTTRHIADTLVYRGRRNHSVARAEAVRGGDWNCPIPPYTLGAWLGDGSSASGAFTSADPDIIERIKLDGFDVSKNSTEYRYHIKGLVAGLGFVGVLNSKHIPKHLLRADVDHRIEMLRGLMDTDGCVNSGGGTSEFTGVNERLCLGVFELAASLGLRPKLYHGRATLNGKDCGAKYRIVMANLINPFFLPRKSEKVKVSKRGLAWHDWQQIVDVQPEASVPVRCIMVDHPSHEFLITRNFIPTHNSTFIDAMLVNAMQQHNWSVAYASFENPPEIHVSKLIALRQGKPFGYGPTPRLNNTELDEGMAWVQEHVTFLTHDGVMPTVESLIERFETAVRRNGVKACVVDPFNFIKLNGKDGAVDTEAINEMLSKFKMFAQRSEVVLFIIAHPAKPMNVGKEWVPTGYSISGSAHWYNRADFGLTMHRSDTGSVLSVWKCRFSHQGAVGKAELVYNRATGGFSEPGLPLPGDDSWLDDL
jgi:replicative DNA helicase